MKLFQWSDILSLYNNTDSFFAKGCGISVGSFDGLHKGHRVLINTLVTECKKMEIPAGVVTFTRPLPSLKHKDYKGDISTLNQRLKLLENLGVDFAVVVDFNDDFASMSGIDFFTVLEKNCKLKIISEGVDFRCGYKGATDMQEIKAFAACKQIKAFFVEPVYYSTPDGEKRISSSIIRDLIQNGELDIAAELLDRPYERDSDCNDGNQVVPH